MFTNPLRHLAINENVDAEFEYWKSQLVHAAWTATGFAVAACGVIAFWPQGSGDPELRGFARQFWTLFAECAFWSGFLLGLLWGAAKRLGAALAGTLPWQPPQQLGNRAATARVFGQAAVGFAMAGVFLWITGRLARLGEAGAAMSWFDPVPLMQACAGAAVVFAAVAVIGRDRRAAGYKRTE